MNDELIDSGAHHGAPTLYQRDIRMMQDFMLWVTTARLAANGGYTHGYGPEWWPSVPDMLKSRLFWRIRSGKKPLDYPPPTSFSCPWYELIEVPGPHATVDEIHGGIGVTTMGAIFRAQAQGITECAQVAQCLYGIVSEADGKWVLSYGPYRFRAWNAMSDWMTTRGGKEFMAGYIERAPDLEGATEAVIPALSKDAP